MMIEWVPLGSKILLISYKLCHVVKMDNFGSFFKKRFINAKVNQWISHGVIVILWKCMVET